MRKTRWCGTRVASSLNGRFGLRQRSEREPGQEDTGRGCQAFYDVDPFACSCDETQNTTRDLPRRRKQEAGQMQTESDLCFDVRAGWRELAVEEPTVAY